MATCTHLDTITSPSCPRRSPAARTACATGDNWLHLRICLDCGHVGCCDDSPNRHASKHAGGRRAPAHPLARARRGLGPGASPTRWRCNRRGDQRRDADPAVTDARRLEQLVLVARLAQVALEVGLPARRGDSVPRPELGQPRGTAPCSPPPRKIAARQAAITTMTTTPRIHIDAMLADAGTGGNPRPASPAVRPPPARPRPVRTPFPSVMLFRPPRTPQPFMTSLSTTATAGAATTHATARRAPRAPVRLRPPRT